MKVKEAVAVGSAEGTAVFVGVAVGATAIAAGGIGLGVGGVLHPTVSTATKIMPSV